MKHLMWRVLSYIEPQLKIYTAQALILATKFKTSNGYLISDEMNFFFKHKELQNALSKSNSQLGQDLLALVTSGFKRRGFFVEFGATDGVSISNTYLLEKEYGWSGILVEPAKSWHSSLKKNRPFAKIDTRVVWSSTGKNLTFIDVAKDAPTVFLKSEKYNAAELSAVADLAEHDAHRGSRKFGTRYEVESISLNDLLELYQAPHLIDFLSIDVEGAEFEILSGFDFSRRKVNLICCEHNFSEQRHSIFSLMKKNGYKRILAELSDFDDWYIKE